MQQLVLELAPPRQPTFASYVPGRNAAAVQALERALAGEERFVYLWGPPGSGKSHLLRSFADAARACGVEAAVADDVNRLDQPGQIALFDQYNRLRASGGVLQLHPLSDDEKTAALRGHAASRGIALGDELIRYLLSHFRRDMGTQI